MEMKTVKLILLCAAALISIIGMATAASDLTTQTPVEVRVQLGDKDNSLRFLPENLEFETGKLYKLVLHNPSPEPHYFSSEGLSRSVFTRKAQVLGTDGKTIAEVKGHISEIELYPGATAEWWFVPVKAGRLNDLKCTIKGHAEKGMTGTITIK
ncbi:MAG: biphenyl 2,3-dioxygenase [Deltaproteobacteria bacterium]|nr:biphenyl 2,3-dioxygenase [Deltaproteobacteria bacterium]